MANILFQGKPLHTSGDLPAVGEIAPDFELVNQQMETIRLSTFVGKRKILSIVPSLDTPICAASSRKFNQKASHLVNTVVFVISADLPFAQCRFCETEDLSDIIALSCFRSGFADDYGVKLVDGPLAGLTARAVLVVDEHDKVIYHELVAELSEEPNYDSLLAALSQAHH